MYQNVELKQSILRELFYVNYLFHISLDNFCWYFIGRFEHSRSFYEYHHLSKSDMKFASTSKFPNNSVIVSPCIRATKRTARIIITRQSWETRVSLFPESASPFRDYLPQRSVKFSNSCCWANSAPFLDLISPSPATRARTDIFLACRSTWNSQAAVTRCVSVPSARSNSAGNFTEKLKSRISYACNEARLK